MKKEIKSVDGIFISIQGLESWLFFIIPSELFQSGPDRQPHYGWLTGRPLDKLSRKLSSETTMITESVLMEFAFLLT